MKQKPLSSDLGVSTFDGARNEIIELYMNKFSNDVGLKNILETSFYVEDTFSGLNENYGQCLNCYHNTEHTVQATVANARILYGLDIDEKLFSLGVTASLLHDTGYIPHKKNDLGMKIETGGYFTKEHVQRSCDFALDYMSHSDIDYSVSEVALVQRIIMCTGLNPNPKIILFENEEQKLAGYALGTGDLLGQMAAPNYIEKLPCLYAEFVEGEITNFSSPGDLKSKTPGFWKFTKNRLNSDFKEVYKALDNWKSNGVNIYLDAIEKNISKLI